MEGAVRLIEAVLELPLSEAVIVTVSVVQTVPAVALKVAVALPAGAVAETGIVRSELLSDNETAIPPVGAALDIVTVQVLAAPDANVAGLHASEDTVGGGAVKLIEAVWELPLNEAVIATV